MSLFLRLLSLQKVLSKPVSARTICKLQTSTIYTFSITKYSLKEKALNNEGNIFLSFIILLRNIFFGISLLSVVVKLFGSDD